MARRPLADRLSLTLTEPCSAVGEGDLRRFAGLEVIPGGVFVLVRG